MNGEDEKINTVSSLVRSKSEQQLCIIHAICHVMGMLSACANPVIYGFLNENFHREFKDLFQEIKGFFNRCKPENNNLTTDHGLELNPLVENGQKPQNGQNGQKSQNGVVKTEGDV